MPKLTATIYALHGFLGRPTDWDDVFAGLPEDLHRLRPHFFLDPAFRALDSEDFISDIKVRAVTSPKIFLGYSLGGRIGLKIMERDPHLFDHYIFVSTHPGLAEEHLKRERLAADQRWADCIVNLPWNDFINRWNHQPVFSLNSHPARDAELYAKDRLVTALTKWSLGLQRDYTTLIKKNQNRMTWIAGAADPKFLQISQKMRNEKIISDLRCIPGGHRLWSENPLGLREIIADLLIELQRSS